MGLGRASGAACYYLQPFSKFTEAGGGTTLARFAMEGAKSVIIIWKADSGTPTMTIGAYMHPKSTRETTLANVLLANVQTGATVAAGQSNVIHVTTTQVPSSSPIALPVQELDVQAVGNVTNLDVKLFVLY